MLILPSGRIVDLSTDRAKYHALRKSGPASTAVHTNLYPVVDVIYRYRDEDGVIRRGWSEHDYRYSGYTLADIRQAEDWHEDDKRALENWLRDEPQRRIIESARRRLSPQQDTFSVKTSSAPSHLYSLLLLRLKQLPLQSASATQWRATIKNMQKSGLRADEYTSSGIESYLLSRTDQTPIRKDDILNAIQLHHLALKLSTEQVRSQHGNLNFHEHVCRMSHQAVYRAALKLDHSCHCILRFRDPDTNYRIGLVKTLENGHPMALNKYWFALDPYGRALRSANNERYFTSSDEAMQAANYHATTVLGMRGGRNFHTRYDHLTLYGGQDYREWLVSLSDHQRTYFGSHHLDHNVLVHIRTTTRRDSSGRKLLFLEEIQSDWHQQGRKHGYDNNPWGTVAHAPFKKEWALLATKLMLIRASRNGYDAIAWSPGVIHEHRYGAALPGIRNIYDKVLPDELHRLCKPFNTQPVITRIKTCEPWLNLVKDKGKWRVEDHMGKFKTRNRYLCREEAMQVLYRHSRSIEMDVTALLINDQLRSHIDEFGLPLFGTNLN